MSADILDNIAWAEGSESLGQGVNAHWQEIRADASSSNAGLWETVAEVSRLYWDGVQEELAAAIIAFTDLEEHQPDASVDETLGDRDFENNKVRGLVDLWNPLGQEQAASITATVEAQWRPSIEGQSLRERRARGLLQALGLLDVDFVREARRPVFRSWGQMPQVDASRDSCLVARQCSECRRCIRTFHYYECGEGCEGSGVPDAYKMFTKSDMSDALDLPDPPLLHYYYLKIATKSSPYRLCPACMPRSKHPRDHLRCLRGYTKSGDEKALEFARELNLWEDTLDGRFLASLGVDALDMLARKNRMFSRVSTRRVFPAGNFHCAVMFGPLLIENGRTRYPGGASISRRPVPNFTASSSTDLRDLLSDPSRYRDYGEERDALHETHLALSHKKRLYKADFPLRQRRFVSCDKQLAGGLFTGYCDRFSEADSEIIQAFVQAGDEWKTVTADHSLLQKDYRNAIHALALDVLLLVREVYGEEIRKAILCFSSRLHHHVKLQYNRLTNNCQDFCNAMVLNNDEWDNMFQTVYPLMPPILNQTERSTCIRYMMSFAERMGPPMGKMRYVDPLASTIPLYDSFGHNDADLVDHIASLRFKHDPEGFSLGMTGRCHDPYLLKATEHTCHSESNSLCTLGDHLLDGPHDNLSILATHVHRHRDLYTIPISNTGLGYDIFLTKNGPTAWIQNRLGLLHRLLMLNTALALVARNLQNLAIHLDLHGFGKQWAPPRTLFARAWPHNQRLGDQLVPPRNLESLTKRAADEPDGRNGTRDHHIHLMLTIMHAVPYVQQNAVWETRIKALRSRLQAKPRAGKAEALVFPYRDYWSTCACETCAIVAAHTNCVQAKRLACLLQDPAKRVSTSHPDFVSAERLRASLKLLREQREVAVQVLGMDGEEEAWGVLGVLFRAREYLGVEVTKRLLAVFGIEEESDVVRLDDLFASRRDAGENEGLVGEDHSAMDAS